MSETPRKRVVCLIEGQCMEPRDCTNCGFEKSENKRRKRLPLVRGENGKRHKIIKHTMGVQKGEESGG